jgi:MSHA biogenesis protein MshN
MSVINQVLKDLDRQGANTSAPQGVVAINTTQGPAANWPLRMLGGLLIGLVAAWWFWPVEPVSSAKPAAESTPAPAPVPMPVALVEQQITPQLTLSETLTPQAQANPLTEHADPPVTKPVTTNPQRAKPAALIAISPRLDKRLPEQRLPEIVLPADAAQRVVKEIKPPSAQMQAEEAWRQAVQLLEQGRNHDAQARLEFALRLDPGQTAARQKLIALLLEAGNTASAEALLREGMLQHPNDAWYPRSLAQVHLQRGDFVQAGSILKTSLGKHPDATNWALYASTQAKLDKPAESALAYREALRLDPNQGNWWIGMAVALEKSNARTDAGAAYQRALQTRLGGELREFAAQKARSLAER